MAGEGVLDHGGVQLQLGIQGTCCCGTWADTRSSFQRFKLCRGDDGKLTLPSPLRVGGMWCSAGVTSHHIRCSLRSLLTWVLLTHSCRWRRCCHSWPSCWRRQTCSWTLLDRWRTLRPSLAPCSPSSWPCAWRVLLRRRSCCGYDGIRVMMMAAASRCEHDRSAQRYNCMWV